MCSFDMTVTVMEYESKKTRLTAMCGNSRVVNSLELRD